MRAPLTYEAARAAADSVLTAGRAEGLRLAVVDRGGITRVPLADDGVGHRPARLTGPLPKTGEIR